MSPNTLFARLCSPHLILQAWDEVKAKRAAGGVDRQSVDDFAKDLPKQIEDIISELKSGMWKPQPYLRVEIPKKTHEKRRLGLLTVKDKVIQQAIKLLVEPKFEALFVPNSYGYRKDKGALRAIRCLFDKCKQKNLQYALKLDIDDYFDNIDHAILQKRVEAVIKDSEIVRLIMLCIKMGVVTKHSSWSEVTKGVPQGAVLSPLLANLYLSSFDQSVLSKTDKYIRYADDFVLLCKTEEEVHLLQKTATRYLTEDLHLSLNEPELKRIDDGFEFLGVIVSRQTITISEKKKTELFERINTLRLHSDGISVKDAKTWSGITRYYAQLLQEDALQELDKALYEHLKEEIVSQFRTYANRNVLSNLLQKFVFLSVGCRMRDKELKRELISFYLDAKREPINSEMGHQNKKIIAQRKREYQKKEEADAEMLVSTPGSFIGYSKGQVVVKNKGLVIAKVSFANLKHITVMSNGVSFSSNLLNQLDNNNISLDLFSLEGQHRGGFIQASSIQCALWDVQAITPILKRNALAASIVEGKALNQLYLVKYFHKYHKNSNLSVANLLGMLEGRVNNARVFIKRYDMSAANFIEQLMAHEAQCALQYWAYMKGMLEDDDVGFEGRVQQGAVDIVNMMLNYGYALLYSRVWRALLGNGLNPYDSVIHARQSGKPTFVYDVVELFRAQAVDRVVFSLVQKGEPLKSENGMLSKETKKLLIRNMMERLQKRENYRGEKISLDTIIWRQCSEIADFFAKEAKYKPYKSKW